jgi:transaldolase
MPIFVDSSDLNALRDCYNMGLCAGVTTNPLILSKEAPGVDLKRRVLDILELTRVPISVELTTETEKEMLDEAAMYRSWAPEYIVIKVPMSPTGLKVTRTLERGGARVNMTCIMSFNQAYLAAHAGASYVSIFSGRVKDMGYDPVEIIKQTRAAIDRESWPAQIIVGSIRHLADVNDAFAAGAHIVTIPPPILQKMCWNPRTEETIREFNDAWAKQKR